KVDIWTDLHWHTARNPTAGDQYRCEQQADNGIVSQAGQTNGNGKAGQEICKSRSGRRLVIAVHDEIEIIGADRSRADELETCNGKRRRATERKSRNGDERRTAPHSHDV